MRYRPGCQCPQSACVCKWCKSCLCTFDCREYIVINLLNLLAFSPSARSTYMPCAFISHKTFAVDLLLMTRPTPHHRMPRMPFAVYIAHYNITNCGTLTSNVSPALRSDSCIRFREIPMNIWATWRIDGSFRWWWWWGTCAIRISLPIYFARAMRNMLFT